MIEAVGLCKSFDGNQVIKNFSCQLPARETTCIMGPSGCGKTTFMRMLMGLDTPDEGRILGLHGQRFSAVFQEDRLAENFSAYRNARLAAPKDQSKQSVLDAFMAVGLKEAFQPVREMSGGMRRRVAILRALSAPYDVLFLDEPFKGLDADTKQEVMAYVKTQTKGKTVVMVTHEAQEAEAMCAHIIHIQE